MILKTHALAIAASLLCLNAPAQTDSSRWWPTQAVPKGIVRTTSYTGFSRVTNPNGQASPAELGATHMMVQSVAGLAAKAVNEGKGDELVWVGTRNRDYEDWYARMLRHVKPEVRGTLEPWGLVDRYIKKGVIKGYILYRYDFSKGEINDHRPGMDNSVNVATSMAGLLDGILIEEGQEERAKKRGLKLLLDARGKSQEWCFDAHRDRFNRRLICMQDPKKPHTRDLAIAHKAFTMYGYDEPERKALEWLEPLSPVLGWNGGAEDRTTSMSSIYGHIQTATDWCMNLPVLMAGSETAEIPRFPAVDPSSIDHADKRPVVSFVITDGDNVQWYLGGFYRSQGPELVDQPRPRQNRLWLVVVLHASRAALPLRDPVCGRVAHPKGLVRRMGGRILLPGDVCLATAQPRRVAGPPRAPHLGAYEAHQRPHRRLQFPRSLLR